MVTSLNTLISAVLFIIPGSVAIRIIICHIQINTDPEQESIYKRRAKNAIIYAIIAECAFGILTLAYNYFS